MDNNYELVVCNLHWHKYDWDKKRSRWWQIVLFGFVVGKKGKNCHVLNSFEDESVMLLLVVVAVVVAVVIIAVVIVVVVVVTRM